MRVLVTGSEGMLGRALMNRLQDRQEPTGIDLADGDLCERAFVAELLRDVRPDWVVHCAAWTDVDGAEKAPEAALRVNAGATEILLRACEEVQSGLTYISTDYVFSGQGDGYAEDEPRDPVNHYGLTKARGEEAVIAAGIPWQIVRTSWMFGDGKTNFVKTMLRLLQQAGPIRVVADQRGCPTYAEDLAEVLGFLVSGRHRGIFHGTNRGVCTWFEFAREIAAGSGDDPGRILPCASDEYPRPARRPANSVLLSRRLEAAGYPDRPTWQEALGRYLERLTSGRVLYP